MTHERFLIVDMGSQYAQLIARRVREHGCYAEIVMPDVSLERVESAQGVLDALEGLEVLHLLF